jgi:ABC-type branched-subunit amino acid transport system ATPase component
MSNFLMAMALILHKIKLVFPLAEVILLTAYGKISDGVQAMKKNG